MEKKKIIIVAAVAVVLIGLIVVLANIKKPEMKNEGNAVQPTATMQTEAENTDTETPTPEPKRVTPTFMYFISKADADFEATNTMLDELKAEYSERVNFNIINVDEVPDAAEAFSVQGQTPAVIMLDVFNDMSAFHPQCKDKEILKKYIEAALNK